MSSSENYTLRTDLQGSSGAQTRTPAGDTHPSTHTGEHAAENIEAMHTGTHMGKTSHPTEHVGTHVGEDTHHPTAHTGEHTTTHHTDSHASDSHHSGGLKEKVASVFRSPAVKKHDKVLANSVDHIVAESEHAVASHPDLSDDTRLATADGVAVADMTDHEKAKLLKKERDSNATTGNFVLADAKPALVQQGYGEYYGAKAATQNRT